MTQSASMGGDISADNPAGGSGETLAPKPYVLGDAVGPLNRDELVAIDAWWRAANYLAVGQIYLLDNPLLREPLQSAHIKPRLLGHFGTVPGLNLVWAHASRQILRRDLNAVFVAGPGHGGPGPNACAWLEGTYSELYSHIGQDTAGMAAFFRQFSYPGGVPSHCAPETPGSFHEGGELGYSLLHAFGAAFDNPDLTVFCVVGDGEAETGPLATSWHELPPPRITDDPCEATVGDHTHDVEVLDVEHLVLARRSALPSGRYIVCVAFRTCSERSMPEYVWTKGILGASSAPNRAWPMSKH